MFRKFFAKLVSFESRPKPKVETGQEKFNRSETEEKRLAEERQQANQRRMAEQGSKNKGDGDITEELERFGNK